MISIPSSPTRLPFSDKKNANYKDIQTYYEVAGPDYRYWSKNFNMHFGYYRRFQDLFSLEKMLENMNDEVLGQLQVEKDDKPNIADLGCGMGAVTQFAAQKFPNATITGITIVDSQVEDGNDALRKKNLDSRAHIYKKQF